MNAGGGWGSNKIDNSFSPGACNAPAIICAEAFPDFVAPLAGLFDIHSTGFIGGGQAGYNYQNGAFLWGIETDFQGTNIKGNTSTSASFVFPPPAVPGILAVATSTGSEKLDWLGTLRGRLGWIPTPPLLVYATGGLAYGRVQTGASFSLQESNNGVPLSAGLTAVSQSDTRAGWTVGGGLEWMFAPQWSVKGEYLYYDLGTVTLNQTLAILSISPGSPGIFVNVNVQSTARYTGNIARLA